MSKMKQTGKLANAQKTKNEAKKRNATPNFCERAAGFAASAIRCVWLVVVAISILGWLSGWEVTELTELTDDESDPAWLAMGGSFLGTGLFWELLVVCCKRGWRSSSGQPKVAGEEGPPLGIIERCGGMLRMMAGSVVMAFAVVFVLALYVVCGVLFHKSGYLRKGGLTDIQNNFAAFFTDTMYEEDHDRMSEAFAGFLCIYIAVLYTLLIPFTHKMLRLCRLRHCADAKMEGILALLNDS